MLLQLLRWSVLAVGLQLWVHYRGQDALQMRQVVQVYVEAGQSQVAGSHGTRRRMWRGH